MNTNQNNTAKDNDDNNGKPDFAGWPEASQMAAQEIMGKYGNPDVQDNDVMIWMNKDPWKKIMVEKADTKHSFPVEHTDMMTQCVSYKVPLDKLDELGKFDGSVVYDRTQGLLSARCDKEMNNFLALNLSYDVITGKKSVDQARKAYADIVKEKMGGGDPEYMKKLQFSAQGGAADPDINTTGMDKKGNKVAEPKM
jgi:hypothetical protein